MRQIYQAKLKQIVLHYIQVFYNPKRRNTLHKRISQVEFAK